MINKFKKKVFNDSPISLEQWLIYTRCLSDKDWYQKVFYGVLHPVLDRDIDFEELTVCIRNLKTDKAPGIDQIFNEFKSLPTNWILYIQVLFNKILKLECTPKAWSKPVVTCSLKREISLILEIIAQLLRLIRLLSYSLKFYVRHYDWAEHFNIIPECQTGFRRNRYCLDNIYVLFSVIHLQLRLPKRKVYSVFGDFERALIRFLMWWSGVNFMTSVSVLSLLEYYKTFIILQRYK